MDLILYGAKIRALSGVLSETAIAMKDGKIVALGNDECTLGLAQEGTQTFNLHGKTVYPGFGDSHMHLLHFGITLREVDLKGARSVDELVQLCKDFICKNRIPAGETVYAHGWNQDAFPDKRIPTRYDLDRASTQHPIVASRICGHLATGNTLALEEYGITPDTAVSGGEVYTGVDGMLTGVVSENAVSLLYRAQQQVDVETVMNLLKQSSAYAASKGITAVHSDDLTSMTGCDGKTVIEAYRALAQRDELSVRVYEQCQLPDEAAFNGFLADGYAPGQVTDTFALHSLKMVTDGSLGGRTAYLRAPYLDDAATRGIMCYTTERIDEMVALAHQHDMPVALHAIGDAAMDICLNAIEKAQKKYPEHNPHHGIVHCQITDEALLDRFASLGVQAYVQPVFLEYDAHIVDARVGEQLGATSYNWLGLLNRNVNVSGGSDCPVEAMDSLPNFYCAMRRMDFEGKPTGGWHPEGNLSAQQTLEIFTRNVAAASGDQGHRGDICVGYDADLTVLGEDFFTVDPAHVQDIQPHMTVMNGKIRYRADA